MVELLSVLPRSVLPPLALKHFLTCDIFPLACFGHLACGLSVWFHSGSLALFPVTPEECLRWVKHELALCTFFFFVDGTYINVGCVEFFSHEKTNSSRENVQIQTESHCVTVSPVDLVLLCKCVLRCKFHVEQPLLHETE